ncbi:MAG: hypothetical protein AABX98_01835 [Nanoarchaeota archaeon]
MIDVLVNRVIGTRDEFGARYDLALFRICKAFYDPQRDPVPNDNPVRFFIRDAALNGLALYEATLMRPGSASRDHTRERRSSYDNVVHLPD